MRKGAHPLLRLAMVLALALGTGSCSTVSDTVSDIGSTIADLDPTGLLSDDSTPPATPDQSAATTDDTNTTTPDLASMPAQPTSQTTPAQNQQTTDSLSTDRSQVQYSADALRGGTEAAAPPPGPASAMTPAQAQAAAAPPPSVTQAAVPVPGAEPSVAQDLIASAVPAVPAAAPPTAEVPPPGAEPAVPMTAPGTAVASLQSGAVSDAALGFQPSSAPPLDPSISQWVSAPIIARYQQTAANAGIATSPITPIPAIQTPADGLKVPLGGVVGRPDMTSGAVIANLDALQASPGSVSANMNGSMAPTAVVYFPGDGTTLNAAALAEIHRATAAYKAAGEQGTIRIIGHASSRTANMPVEKHLMVIFQKSQARATAVAKELIREGIPADKVLVEAVGDSQPVYYESMPEGEDGNRRAEIFFQG